MRLISLYNVIPSVFAAEAHAIDSQIWRQDHVAFYKGESYLITAESGTGKSSLCSFIYGWRTDFSGTIVLDYFDIETLHSRQWTAIRNNNIAYLPQEMRLFAELTARENVELKNRLTGFKTPEQIARMFEALEIDNRIDTPVGRLSIGQQQRVAIIRTLCQPFDFILLDEPVSHLDARNNDIAARLIADEAAAQGAAIIATSVGYDININFNYSLRL
ncbi:MAG: ATP-binding cassette domain-containing protein [Muribaculaceae bacterium]|nr:ATP-binding cassette domain-containing protein [Muribaculaceae bacterium]